MARAKARRARRPKASERSAASEAVGEARQRRVEEAAAMSQRLRVLLALWMAFSVQALASAGQLCRTWRDKATGMAGKLAAAASGHKKMLFRLSIIVLLVTLAMVNVCVFKTCWAARRIWEDSTAQEIERLQQAASELRAQLDCYQTPDWALQSFGEDTGRQALLPCASPRLRPLALISSPIITGATIDTRRTSPIYELRSWFSRHCFWCSVNPPDTILQPGVSLGECWPMEGQQGQVVIRLRAKIRPSCVTLEHITPEMTPSGTASSAPRDVAVFGLDADSEEEVPLVSFTFDVGEGPTQTFLLKNNHSRAFRYIKVLVKSNWGHPRYTCLYRVQVHGKVVKTEDHRTAESLNG
ncbi:sperm-associated antigen 4 protein-like isoform X4 [Gallus gallus]|nr:sperm-associated antigen 4 protein-like isoform X4 [Gallus gallus]